MIAKAKEVQQDVMENAHKIWLAGLGALAVAEEEGSKFFKGLMEKGEDMEAKGKDQIEKARGAVTGVKTVAESYWDTFGQTLDEKLSTVIHRLGVPTKKEIDALNKKVDALNKAIKGLKTKETKAAPKKTATRKPATRKPAARKTAATTEKKTAAATAKKA